MLPEKLVGQQLGPYQIEAILGSGGMAVVYRARRNNETLAALKVLFPPPDISAEVRLRFEREARTAARLHHPAIVPILDAGQTDGYAYLAMPLVEGQTLADRLAQTGPLHEAAAADIAWQIADALDYAHRQGVVHRDVKPANILLTNEGQALLTDFGVAQALDDPALTRTGHTVGTPAYMAPEQASGDQSIDGRADLYALGVVLYQMITGRTPFQGTTPRVLHAHLYEPPPPPSSVTRISPALEAIIMKALAKELPQRFQSGAAMAQALAEVSAQTGTQLFAPASNRPKRSGTLRSRWLWLLPVIFMAALGIWQFNSLGAATPTIFVELSPTSTATATSTEQILLAVVSTPEPSPTFTLAPSSTATVSDPSTVTPTSSPTPSPLPSPTLTFTPLPPTDTPIPLPTPTLCPQPEAPEFAGLLVDEGLHNRMGCPRGGAIISPMAWQPFENGAMLWRADLNLIYILEPEARWRSTGDTWREGDPDFDPALAAPNGLHQPVRGFGLVWREQAGVRELLGWATAEEQGFQAMLQEFSGGLIWQDAPRNRFFILFNDGEYQIIN